MALNLSRDYFWLYYYRSFRSTETFEFQGKPYRYLFHPYCSSWKNERAVVIPIVWNVVREYQEKGKQILEVGNVLSYVFNVNHDILDKYEVAEGVINEDVVRFNPHKRYDLIVSIFTIQYVGWDENPQDHMKFRYALENLKKLLAPGGQIIVIHPVGENIEMDKALKDDSTLFSKQFYLKKISGYKWQEVKLDDISDVNYDQSIPSANGIIIASYIVQ